MTQLPIDIWWIILKMVLQDSCSYDFNLRKYNKRETPFRSVLYSDANYVGEWITSDLYIMRTLCKTTKKMVDKYSRRYVDGYEGNNKRYYLIFPYE